MAFSEDVSINTLIGPGAKFNGDINVDGFIRIDGDVDGNIETSSNIIIGEKARIRGNITSVTAVIGGIVEGNIFSSEKLKILNSASVIGDIMTKRLQVEENVLLHGHCISIKNEKDFEKAQAQHANEVSIRSKMTKKI